MNALDVLLPIWSLWELQSGRLEHCCKKYVSSLLPSLLHLLMLQVLKYLPECIIFKFRGSVPGVLPLLWHSYSPNTELLHDPDTERIRRIGWKLDFHLNNYFLTKSVCRHKKFWYSNKLPEYLKYLGKKNQTGTGVSSPLPIKQNGRIETLIF